MADVGRYRPPPLRDEIVKKWDEAKKHHDAFVSKYERGERAYQGILSGNDDAAKWRHKYAPKYALNLIETIVSSTVEMGLQFDVRPAPHSQAKLDEAMEMLNKSDTISDLVRHEHRIDEFDYLQRPTFLTVALAGYAVLKPSWSYRTANVTKMVPGVKTVEHASGMQIDVPTMTEKEVQEVYDHSTTELCDPRDFVIHESAKSLDPFKPGGAQHCFHRGWYSFEQLKMMEKGGFLSNVDRLKETLDFSSEYEDRELKLWEVNRTKDLIEVLEYWCMKNGSVYRSILGNRMVVLRDEERNPFSHGTYPFIICSSMPQPFTVKAISDIELVAELQNMLWEVENQSLDNMELINNWITLIRKDVDNPDGFDYYPGAFWEVDAPDQLQTLQPPYQLLEGTMGRENSIRTDMQNVTSAVPFSGGTQLAGVQQNTATGASIVMNAAQQRMIAKKYQAQQGLRNEATMRIKLCQQFITDDRLLHILGPDGKTTFRDISPLEILGDYVVELEPMGESNMRQEKRSEAMQWAGWLLQSAPLFAASGQPLNLGEIVKWAAKRWNISDVERFFSQQQAAMGAMGAPGQGGGGGQGAPDQGGNMGITAGSAIDASSPSAAGQISGSPVAAASRALAMGGGAGNQ